jgi:hypothetical protein
MKKIFLAGIIGLCFLSSLQAQTTGGEKKKPSKKFDNDTKYQKYIKKGPVNFGAKQAVSISVLEAIFNRNITLGYQKKVHPHFLVNGGVSYGFSNATEEFSDNSKIRELDPGNSLYISSLKNNFGVRAAAYFTGKRYSTTSGFLLGLKASYMNSTVEYSQNEYKISAISFAPAIGARVLLFKNLGLHLEGNPSTYLNVSSSNPNLKRSGRSFLNGEITLFYSF